MRTSKLCCKQCHEHTKTLKLIKKDLMYIYNMRLWLRRLVAGFPMWWPRLEPRSGYVGFMVDRVALGQVFSKYFGFPCQFSFNRLRHIHRLSSRAGTIGQTVANIPSGLSLTPPQETKKNNWLCVCVHVLARACTYIHGITLKREENLSSIPFPKEIP
jgi:hypothetical protein